MTWRPPMGERVVGTVRSLRVDHSAALVLHALSFGSSILAIDMRHRQEHSSAQSIHLSICISHECIEWMAFSDDIGDVERTSTSSRGFCMWLCGFALASDGYARPKAPPSVESAFGRTSVAQGLILDRSY